MICYPCWKLRFVKLVNCDAFCSYCMYGNLLVLYDLMKLKSHFCFLYSKKVKNLVPYADKT